MKFFFLFEIKIKSRFTLHFLSKKTFINIFNKILKYFNREIIREINIKYTQ